MHELEHAGESDPPLVAALYERLMGLDPDAYLAAADTIEVCLPEFALPLARMCLQQATYERRHEAIPWLLTALDHPSAVEEATALWATVLVDPSLSVAAHDAFDLKTLEQGSEALRRHLSQTRSSPAPAPGGGEPNPPPV